MSTAELKEQLHIRIDIEDNEKILEAIYTLLNKEEVDFELTDEELLELDKQTEDYLAGKLETYSWEEVKSHIKEKYEI
ncbi:MAG: hypothetical protein H6553_04110 [Chitinophagales bacterium]|nr:hypothetical protein [Chitinophagales bacterium]